MRWGVRPIATTKAVCRPFQMGTSPLGSGLGGGLPRTAPAAHHVACWGSTTRHYQSDQLSQSGSAARGGAAGVEGRLWGQMQAWTTDGEGGRAVPDVGLLT